MEELRKDGTTVMPFILKWAFSTATIKFDLPFQKTRLKIFKVWKYHFPKNFNFCWHKMVYGMITGSPSKTTPNGGILEYYDPQIKPVHMLASQQMSISMRKVFLAEIWCWVNQHVCWSLRLTRPVTSASRSIRHLFVKPITNFYDFQKTFIRN